MIYNKGYCFYCGEATENDEDIGNNTIYCCDKSECRHELKRERESERDEKIRRAEEDDYSRY